MKKRRSFCGGTAASCLVVFGGLTTVWTAQPAPYLPEKGDVILRTLHVTETRPGRMGTLDAAHAFGANRVEWIYNVDGEFMARAREAGLCVGTTMNYNAQPEVQKIPDYLEKFTARDLHGNPVTRFNFRKFADWQTLHYSADLNIPEWKEFYTGYLIGLYELPMTSIMRDDQAANAGLISDGGTYTDASIAMFQHYLADHVAPKDLERLGIKDPATFDIRPYLIERGAPEAGKEWLTWDGGPILLLYAKAQREATANFYRTVRARVEEATGRKIPWSCNHTGQWGPIEKVFDYALGEFYTHQMQMETLVEIARRAEQVGKTQGLQGVLDGGWEKRDPAGLVEEMRLGFSTAYALGMLPMVPWDMYMPGKAKRYFGKTGDFADLFRWVRSNHTLFDSYETALITAFNPVNSRQVWHYNQQIARFPIINSPALRINQEGILGVVRSKKSGTDADRVIHLVDWNKERKAFEVTLNLAELCGSSAARVRLLQPGQDPVVLGEGAECTFTIPALNPWGMLSLEALAADPGALAAPRLVEPMAPVAEEGCLLKLAAEGSIFVRQVLPEKTDWSLYTEDVVIDQDMVVEARTMNSGTGKFSPSARWRFWVYNRSQADAAISGEWNSLLAEFSRNLRGQISLGKFPDGSPLRYASQELSDALGSIGEVEMKAVLPEKAAFFRVGIAVADDAEVLRPSYRITVHADGRFLYETPIYNPVKGVVHNQEPGRQDILLMLPFGAKELTLKLHATGWFNDHNRVIWINPAVLSGDSFADKKPSVKTSSFESGRAITDGSTNGSQGFKWTGGEQ